MTEVLAPRILLVEDSALTRQIFKTALEPEGFVISEAPSMATALEEAGRTPPDLFLIDFVLEGVEDGADLAHALKDQAELSSIPRVAVTSVGDARLRQKIDKAPFDLVLHKPIVMSELVAAIKDILAKP